MKMELDPISRVEKAKLLIYVILPFVATLYAIFLTWNQWVDWSDIWLMVAMVVLTNMGVTIGVHRMLAHRGFEAHPAVRFIFLALGSMAYQGSPLKWSWLHIIHHAKADQDGDPHSPVEGFFHAHCGWILSGGYRMDPSLSIGKWLFKDDMAVFFHRTIGYWNIASLLIPFAIGGWSGLLWGGLVRIFLNNHITWCVNSVCHVFGSRDYETKDESRNNWVIAIFALGEGWHNNHHAFPRSAIHGLKWYQFDFSAYIILALEKLGLVWDVQRVPPEKLMARLIAEGAAVAD